MNTFLKLAFLFYIGSSLGWVLELFFRRFISGNNPERKWINPGFMVGPYVPLYGTGLCILYLVSRLSESRQIADPVWNHIAMLVLMAAAMTAIEYIAGILLLKVMNACLWDYSRRWGNVNGLICPLFSAIWAVMGAAYYFFVDPYILRALDWLSRNRHAVINCSAHNGAYARVHARRVSPACQHAYSLYFHIHPRLSGGNSILRLLANIPVQSRLYIIV